METPVEHSAPLKVLIVEDSPEDRELYRRMLQRQGTDFQIYEAGSVNDGLHLAKEQSMDCILLDYKLPDGDGMDFIHSYRGNRLANHAAIVMVTGQGNERTAVEAMKMGALDYITKASVMEGYFAHSVLNAIERAQLKEEIVKYQGELVRSNAALSEFTHTASHDLKAPLRHIASYCSLLQEELGGKVGPDAEKHLKRLIVNATRLQQLVDDLLTYSEAMNAKEEKAAVDCSALMAEITETLEEAIREAGAKIVAGPLPVISAYPLRMKQLLQNLVSNALKYRSPERPPVIEVTCSDTGTDFLFSVTDNGQGIEAEHREMIFEAFKRLHSRDEIEGSGLGLSICQKIVTMHGGKIWVQSEPGQGATFFFTIPKPTLQPTARVVGQA